jgi:hypothetical protein
MSSVAAADVVVPAVIVARFLVPLAIPRYPLPGVLASMAVDAADQDVFQALIGGELAGYQPYDKALDVYSLSVTMLAILRNWQSRAAVRIARFLFYFRLVGVLVFELTGWRPLLLIFPNTFEYFFVFYEIVRGWWWPERMGTRTLLRAAAVIWVGIKIPQECWLHVARMDLSNALRETLLGLSPTARGSEGLALALTAVVAMVALGIAGVIAYALAPPPRHARRLAADPLPVSIDEAHERARHVAQHWRVLDRHLVEKVALVALLTVVFAQIVPGVEARPAHLVLGVAVLVTLNAFLRIRSARRGRSVESAVASFLLVAATNAAFVFTADLLLRRRLHGALPVTAVLFLLLLLSLVVTLYDLWHPVFDERFRAAGDP